MATVKAFPALRFTSGAGDISKIVCPPYDIISPEQREEYVNTCPNNVIRLELPVGDDPYAEAGKLLDKWLSDGTLAIDDTPGLYAYEEEFTAYCETKRIKCIFARVKLCEFSENVVLPHEETLSKAKTDRFNLMSATFCNFSPIYSMYSDADRAISSRLAKLTDRTPDIEFTDGEGVIQRLWKIEKCADTDEIERLFDNKQLFIADGHHRYETALNFKKKLIADGVITDDAHPANYVMMSLVDMENDGLVVFPTHRMLFDLESFNPESTLEAISEYFDVSPINNKEEIEPTLAGLTDKKAFVMCCGDEFKLLVLREDEKSAKALAELNPNKSQAYMNLDVTVLHSLVLEKIFGIDKENMANQINLRYTRNLDEAVNAVHDGFDCSFIINATKVAEIKQIALENEKMPQKSTYFYPKMITGLVMNSFTK